VSGRLHRGRLALLCVLVAAIVGLAGCSVTTTVGVQVTPNGSGAVTVDVTFGRQAAAAVGGVIGQLKTSDLAAAGWVVAGPKTGPDDSTVVAVTHRFAKLAQIPGILGEVAAGTGSAAPFALHVTRAGPGDRQTVTATGTVDLSCGLSCFGDAALRKTFGSAVGVNASAFSGPSGRAAARRDFVFHFTLTLPGRLTATGTAARKGGTLTWTPTLWSSTPLQATSLIVTAPTTHTTLPADGAKDSGAAVVVAVVALIILVGLAWRLLRRRRRRKTAAEDDPARGKHRIKTKS
jgi:hypothetical protein